MLRPPEGTDLGLTVEPRTLMKTSWTERVLEQSARGRESPGVLHGGRPAVRAPAARLFCLLAGVLLVAGLSLLAVAPGLAADQEGDVRLVARDANDGEHQGLVQIYHNNQWGGVCDDFWDINDAKVACRQAGFRGAQGILTVQQDPSNSPMWLDNVNCTGKEAALLACQSTRWGPYNPSQCSASEYAGATCKARRKGVLFDTRKVTVDEESTATYQVWLEQAPTADVTVTITGTSSTDVTVSPASLTFTTSNWSDRQTVTVTAASDTDMTDDTVTLSHAFSGGGYATVAAKNVTVTVTDNNVPGMLIEPATLTIVEEDDPVGSYSVVLTGKPSGDVTVAIGGTSGTDVAVSRTSLTFTTSNWDTAQPVTVTASSDTDTADDTVTLTNNPSGGGYDSLPTQNVTVTVEDIDNLGVTVDPTSLSLLEDSPRSGSYSMVLTGKPSASVTVAVSVPSGTVLSVSPASLTFTTSNWSTAQTVQVTAGRDDDRQPNDSAILTHSASGGGYNGVSIASVEVEVRDVDLLRNPVPPVAFDSGGIIDLEESQSDTYRVWLTMDPIGTATVTVNAPSELSVSPASLDFDLDNWSQPQTVTVEAPQDDSDTSDERLQIRHTITEGANTASLESMLVRVTDDDDGEALVGPRPAAALWWAALTARRETGGATGYLDYAAAEDTGKLSDTTFTLGGLTRTIEGLFVQNGTLQVWVDSGDGFQLPNNLVLHVGSVELTLGSASKQSFETTYNDGSAPTMRDHTYRWYAGTHGVSLSDRQVVAVWLEDPSGTYLPQAPRSVQAESKDGAAELKWTAPPEVPAKPILHYEYQQNGSDEWTSTDGADTTTQVNGLVNGETYKFRLRAVNDAGKGAASAPSAPVTPREPALTAAFVAVPSSHDGSTAFQLRVEFSEDPKGGIRKMRDHAFAVTGGTVSRARRVNRRQDLWVLTVEPSSDAAVTVALPAGRACDIEGAVCTAAGEQLSEGVEATIPGPQPTVSISAGTSPVAEGAAAAFTLERVGDTAAELTVSLTVTEDGAALAGPPPAEAVFAAGLSTAELAVATEDDEAAEDASVVTVALAAGTGYAVDANGAEAAVTVDDDDAAPAITNAGPFTVDENATAVATLAATDDDTPVADLVWSVAGGADASAFVLGAGGVLEFAAAKDFEVPDDTDADGTYAVTVQVSDGTNEAQAALTVQLADVDEVAPVLTDAAVDGAALTLAWDEALDDGSTPGVDAFTVTVDGASRAVGAVAVSGSSTVLTLASAVAAGETVTVSYTVPTGQGASPLRDLTENAAAGVSDRAVTNATAAGNTAPTGLPAIAGTARHGETLTASATEIEDADGLANAVFAWQWIANDGTADAAIAGATAATFTLTSAEIGQTVKARITFTDDGGTEETLVSAATAAVAAALPVVSIEAAASPVTEGAAVSFTLRRTGDTAAALAVSVAVTEAGSVLAGALPSAVTFAAGDAEAVLGIATEDDRVAEADARVTAAVSPESGYGVDGDAGVALVDVYDNDEAATASATLTLWTSTLTVRDIAGVILGQLDGGNLSPDAWTEDGEWFRAEDLYYYAPNSEFAFNITASPAEPGKLTLHLDALQLPLTGVEGMQFFSWSVDDPGWQGGQTVAVQLTRTDPDAATDAGPAILVADAQVQEAEGAALSFRVTLAPAPASAVSMRYATANGTATAGADYVAVSGVIRFEAGETAKTISVPVLNDTHDEGAETLTLTLSAPFGAAVSDGTATGTIVNTGPMPQAWLARFGRTVGLQALDAIGGRIAGSRRRGGAQVVVGGVELVGSGASLGGAVTQAGGLDEPERSGWTDPGHGMSDRALLLGSSFQFGAGGAGGGPAWTAWGRFATSSFEGRAPRLLLSGDVTSGFLGADVALERGLAGLAVGMSEGEGSFDDGAGDGAGTVESSLASVFPYARLDGGEGVDIWGLVGVGRGDLRLTVGEEVTDTDLSMRMGALGLRSDLVPPEESGAFGLAVKSDALWVQTESDAARSSTGGNLKAASGDVRRVRVALEGSHAFAVGREATFTSRVELGLRHDGGDAETGTGVEVGVGLQYASPAQGLTVEGSVRGLLTHADDGYKEWGASGSVRLDPGVSGRGVSLAIAPVWGAAGGGVEQLWSTRAGTGLADVSAAAARLRAEIGYGFGLSGNAGVLTPYAAIGVGEAGSREYRTGTRWHLGAQASLSLDAGREEAPDGAMSSNALMMRAAIRF